MTIEQLQQHQLQQYPLGEKGLKIQRTDGSILHVEGFSVNPDDVGATEQFNDHSLFGFYGLNAEKGEDDYLTPILYPLTALTQEITVYGDTFVPIDRIAIYDPNNVDYLIEQIKTGLVEYVVIQLLQKWFINYQGIEAVSPFDLPENPYL